jgi:hypothetical protein
MIHTTNDFFNKVANEIRSTYFPNENHGLTKNPFYHESSQAIELFNNGCLTYRQLVNRLAKSCKDTTNNIHTITSKFIVSFGGYKYKPKK